MVAAIFISIPLITTFITYILPLIKDVIKNKNKIEAVNENHAKVLKTRRVKKITADIFKRLYIYIILTLMYAPILVLIIYSFTDSQLIGFWNGFSLRLYELLFKNTEIMVAVKNTLVVALSSAVVSTVLGTLGAIGMFYSKKKTRELYHFVGQIPILNPEIVTALALSILVTAVGIGFNFFKLLIGHVVLTIPYVILSVLPKLQQLDHNIYEAALDLGAKPSTALRKVIIPEIMPGIVSGFILSITLSLDDYIITAFTKNSSFTTLSTYVYGATAKKGNLPPELRALTTIIFIVTVLVVLLVNLYTTKANNRMKGVNNVKKR